MKKKKNKEGHQRAREGRTPVVSRMKFGAVVEPQNLMNHADFHLNLMASLRSSGGQKSGFTFEMHLALTTLPCAAALASNISGICG
jgi:hypothetical protein